MLALDIISKREDVSTSAEKKPSPKEPVKARYASPFLDTSEIPHAFEILKKKVSTSPILIHPNFNREFILYVDACRRGVGGGLYQVSLEDNRLRPVLFISRQRKSPELRYSATELECLRLFWCLQKLQHYVDGAQLKIYTDHVALKWIWNVKPNVNSRLFKWSMILISSRGRAIWEELYYG